MKLSEIKTYLSNLTGHVTFEYNGYNCGVDPFRINPMTFGMATIVQRSIPLMRS